MVRFAPPIGVVAHTANRFVTVGHTANPGRPAKTSERKVMPEPPTAGMIRVLGRPPGDPAVLRQAGAMGEIAFYPFLSGRDNLRAAARRCGIGDRRVDVVLGQVGLAERAGDAVAGYSYGMRQRLGGSDQIQ